MNKNSENVVITNADIRFRNFEGKKTEYNPKDQRNFAIFLEKEDADLMAEAGWNIKTLPNKMDPQAEPIYMVKVAVQFDSMYPPKVILVKRSGKERLTEENINILDWAEIDVADVAIRPYHWDVQGNTGIKAYLKTLYITLVEDEFEEMYADEIETAQTCVGPDCPVE